jgi:hypothetical protein
MARVEYIIPFEDVDELIGRITKLIKVQGKIPSHCVNLDNLNAITNFWLVKKYGIPWRGNVLMWNPDRHARARCEMTMNIT